MLSDAMQVVHFYNRRDALPNCHAGDPREKTAYWPTPKYAPMNRRQPGNLHLSDEQENQIVASLKTTSGFVGKKTQE
jgi:hypothetical protein